MNKINLWGYTICDNGDIYGLYGKKMKYNKQINIIWGKNKKNKLVSYARFVYYAFNYKTFNFNDKTIIIKHINNDNNDNSLSNLVAIKRKKQIQSENNSNAKLTDEDIEVIKSLYSHKDLSNEKNNPKTKISYRKIAQKYGVSHTTIAGIVKGIYRNKENYILK